MIISFTGDSMHDVMQEMKRFLFGEEGELQTSTTPAVVKEALEPAKTVQLEHPVAQEPSYTAADVRKAFQAVAQLTHPDGAKVVSRDDLRKALKDISGADSVSAAPQSSFGALIEWAEGVIHNAQ